MKIISKYKDYYDYLIGTYGIDPKMVLDRRSSGNYNMFSPGPISFHICNIEFKGFFDGKKYYYGKNLSKVGKKRKYGKWYRKFMGKSEPEYYEIKYLDETGFEKKVDIEPGIKKSEDNIKEDCPIMVKDGEFSHYPQLTRFSVASFLPPEKIYQMLIDWLSERINQQENVIDKRGNVEKLESKGFDKKRSFRPNMK